MKKLLFHFQPAPLGLRYCYGQILSALAEGSALIFNPCRPGSGLYLIAAAGLRLGVFPLHLPYSPDSLCAAGLAHRFG